MPRPIFAALLAATLATPGMAQENLQLQSAVYVERLGHTDDGRVERRVEPAAQLRRGDRLVLVVEWQGSADGRQGFAVTNPIPPSIAFQRASREGVEVSVDGGKSWGMLGALTVRDGRGDRLASPEDVTHLRWRISPQDARRGTGRITYSAIVR